MAEELADFEAERETVSVSDVVVEIVSERDFVNGNVAESVREGEEESV